MIKIDSRKLKFRTFFVFSSFVLYLILLYINFNIPVFQQLFANAFYVPVEVQTETETETERRNFRFISLPSCSIPLNNIYLRNIAPCDGAPYKTPYVYIVHDKKYTMDRASYLSGHFFDTPEEAYYFPLYPAWSVSNKEIHEEYWNAFLRTSQGLLFVLMAFLFFYARVFKNKENIREIIKEDSRAYLLLSGIILVPTCMALYHIFSIGELLRHCVLQTDRAYRDVVRPAMHITVMIVMLIPSYVLLLKCCTRLSTIKKIVIPAISCLAIWYCTKLFNLGLVIAMRLILVAFILATGGWL